MIKILFFPIVALCIQPLWASDVAPPSERDYVKSQFKKIKKQIELYEQSLNAQTKCCLCNFKKYITSDPKYVHVKQRMKELCTYKAILCSKDFKREKKISLLLQHLELMNGRQPFNKYGDGETESYGKKFYETSKILLEECRTHLSQEKVSSSL